jgi:hypothetical protein
MTDISLMKLQARGKVRRFVQSQFRKQEVHAMVAQRRGECSRCGECCRILFRCPFLCSDGEGGYLCRIYERRFEQCRHYPIQACDLREVENCSYIFPAEALVPSAARPAEAV